MAIMVTFKLHFLFMSKIIIYVIFLILKKHEDMDYTNRSNFSSSTFSRTVHGFRHTISLIVVPKIHPLRYKLQVIKMF